MEPEYWIPTFNISMLAKYLLFQIEISCVLHCYLGKYSILKYSLKYMFKQRVIIEQPICLFFWFNNEFTHKVSVVYGHDYTQIVSKFTNKMIFSKIIK